MANFQKTQDMNVANDGPIFDQEIVRLIRSEKKEDIDAGIGKLAKKYGGMLHAIMRRNCGWPPNDPCYDDVYNCILAKIFKSMRNGFRDEGKLQAYIGRVAKCTAIDARRKRNRECVRTEPYKEGSEITPEPTAPLAADPCKSMDIESTNMAINEAIMKLDRIYREVIQRYYSEDQPTYAKIAKELNISDNTVSTRLFRGREKLKLLLPDWVIPME